MLIGLTGIDIIGQRFEGRRALESLGAGRLDSGDRNNASRGHLHHFPEQARSSDDRGRLAVLFGQLDAKADVGMGKHASKSHSAPHKRFEDKPSFNIR